MRHFFTSWLRPAARIFGGTALAIGVLGSTSAGAAIVMSANSDRAMASYARTGTDLLIDWNQEVVIYSGIHEQNTDRPALAALEPDESQASDIASNEDAFNNDATTDNDSTKEALADDCTKDDAIASTKVAAGDDSATGDKAIADDCTKDDASAPSNDVAADQNTKPEDDAIAANEDVDATPEATNNIASDTAASTAKQSDNQATEPEAKSTDTETAGNDTATPAADPSIGSSIEQYYRYRYEPIDGRYGEDRSSATEEDKSSSSEEAIEKDSDDENSTTNSADSDNTVSETNGNGASSTVAAVQTVLSSWTNDLTSGLCGRSAALLMSLLERIR